MLPGLPPVLVPLVVPLEGACLLAGAFFLAAFPVLLAEPDRVTGELPAFSSPVGGKPSPWLDMVW